MILLLEEIKDLALDDFVLELELAPLLLDDAAIEAVFAFVGVGFELAFAFADDGFLEKKLKSVPCFFAEADITILVLYW